MPGRSRLATLLQCMCFAQLALAAGWLAWRWSASPVQALAGAVPMLFAAPLVLALELLIVPWVGRRETSVPRPTVPQLARAWLSECAQWFRTFCWRQPFRWAAEPDFLKPTGRAGVVLVHGFMCNRGFWTPWMRQLRRQGHPYAAVNLEPVFGSIDEYAPILDAAVARVGGITGKPVVLICHSMGGLAVRAWLRTRDDPRKVARVVTIASPHRGTWLARFSRRANGRQMHLGSEWLQRLLADEAQRTPPAFTCWYSNCDNVVFPPSTATLAAADNRFVPGQAHVGLAFHPEVMRASLELVATTDEPPSR